MTGGRPFITTSADLAVLCTQACRSSAEAVDVFPNLKPEILVQTDVSLTLTLPCFESGLAAGKLS
eukprot:COSAG01_NODE_59870_length_297_cov_4.914141_1_plen_64_part_10